MHGDVHPKNLLLVLTYDVNADDDEADIWAKNRRGNELNDADDSFALHDRSIVSADVPTNARVVLIDLGGSSIPADAPSAQFAYPIPYRAPEVVMQMGPVTGKADIWALGCVLFTASWRACRCSRPRAGVAKMRRTWNTSSASLSG
jgi:serine/threonine protein kinase